MQELAGPASFYRLVDARGSRWAPCVIVLREASPKVRKRKLANEGEDVGAQP